MANESLSWIAGEEQRLQCPGGEWRIGTTTLCGQGHGSVGKQEFASLWEQGSIKIKQLGELAELISLCSGAGMVHGVPGLISLCCLGQVSFEGRGGRMEDPTTTGAPHCFCLWKWLLPWG